MNVPVIVLGGGGHAKVVIEALHRSNHSIIGFTTPDFEDFNQQILGIKRLGTDEEILKIDPKEVKLVNGIGSIGFPEIRKNIFLNYKERGYDFINVVHPSVILPRDFNLSEGAQLMAGVVVQPGCHLGNNTILNTRACVDHDCLIGNNVHIASGAIICGDVKIADNVHVGAGSTVIQGISIGKNSIIGAGSVVIRDVPEDVTVIGVPAKEVQR
ncbi:acetyltransferase [Brevibacillus invocatus]|uniref:acetyltransferase n=1 Tax=Brevibacillus invocatus TaxID=173959 RepID=UPI002041668D|nr:acetyltransferase [Brevibacillus invocatus]MCM3079669.1 acetyltransferase [Brevibacillus invocatus]MCM3431121.1 acetyltransferase [Brevibacillus invocatus]